MCIRDRNEPPVVIVDARTGERLRSQREASDETIVVFAVEIVPAAGLVALEVVPLGDRAAPVTPVAVTPASLGVEFERRGVHLTRDRVRLSLASYASPRDEHFGDGPYVTRSSAWHVAPAFVGGAAAPPNADPKVKVIIPNSVAFAARYAAAPPRTSPRCLLYTSPSPRDATLSRMPSSA